MEVCLSVLYFYFILSIQCLGFNSRVEMDGLKKKILTFFPFFIFSHTLELTNSLIHSRAQRQNKNWRSRRFFFSLFCLVLKIKSTYTNEMEKRTKRRNFSRFNVGFEKSFFSPPNDDGDKAEDFLIESLAHS